MATTTPDQYWGTGRRKTSVARVRIREGQGTIFLNGRELDDYFREDKDRRAVLAPLDLTEMRNRLDVFVNVQGGGFSGQAGAVCQGLARALKDMFSQTEPEEVQRAAMEQPKPKPQVEGEEGEEGAEGEEQQEDETPVVVSMVKKLRDSGYLTRDGRMKERKKYGRKGARKSFQFSKR